MNSARLIVCGCLLALGSPAAVTSREDGTARFVAGISPYLDDSVKDEAYRSIVRLLVQELPLNSSLAIYDAFDLKTIAQVTVPDNLAFKSAKTRANQFAPAVRELKRFLAANHLKPASAHLDFQSAIRVPQFFDFLSENLAGTGSPLRVLLMGSPLYQDAKEPAFSMVDGYFPSDGHLDAPRERSIFGYRPGGGPSVSMAVDWVYFGDPWISDLHREKVARFWTLYLERRGGKLETFSGDLATVVDAFRQGSAPRPTAPSRWVIDASQTNVEMLRVSRDVALTDWLTQGNLPDTAQGPPEAMVGRMKIGIRWRDRIDLDLYAAARPGAETLFFQHPRSPEGYYYKDHRSSPGREFEFVEFESPVDVREVEAFVNFYQGASEGGARGEVRVEFGGRIYGAPFRIASTEGNRGRTGQGQEGAWVRIPIKEILKLASGNR